MKNIKDNIKQGIKKIVLNGLSILAMSGCASNQPTINQTSPEYATMGEASRALNIPISMVAYLPDGYKGSKSTEYSLMGLAAALENKGVTITKDKDSYKISGTIPPFMKENETYKKMVREADLNNDKIITFDEYAKITSKYINSLKQ